MSPSIQVDQQEFERKQVMKELYENARCGLWHEVTLTSLKLFHDPKFPTIDLVSLHNSLLRPHHEFLNPHSYARIVLLLSHCLPISERSILFDKLVLKNIEADFCLRIESALCTNESLLKHDALAGVYDKVKAYTENRVHSTISCLLWMQFFRLQSKLFWLQQKWSEFYECIFKYLSYCSEDETLGPMQFDELCSRTAVAALLSPTLYNFGEVLDHAQISCTLKKKNHILYQTLVTFQNGSHESCLIFSQLMKKEFEGGVKLKEHQSQVQQKKKLMRLLHYFFYTVEHTQTFSYLEIERQCHIQCDTVEQLLLCGLTSGLFKGTVDTLNQKFTISWIQPRVLLQHELKFYCNKAENWVKTIREVNSLLSREWSMDPETAQKEIDV